MSSRTGIRNFFWLAKPPDGNACSKLSMFLFTSWQGCPALNQRRCNRIDRNPIKGKSACQGMHQAHLTRFRGCIMGPNHSSSKGRHRRDQDDASPSTLAHTWYHSLSEQECRPKVDLHDIIPLLHGDFFQRALWPNRSITHQDIDAS